MDEILKLIESVSEGFPYYFFNTRPSHIISFLLLLMQEGQLSLTEVGARSTG